MPEDGDAVGIIRYAGPGVEANLKVGVKVYYGKERHRIKIKGIDIEVMDEDNVYAVSGNVDVKEESKS